MIFPLFLYDWRLSCAGAHYTTRTDKPDPLSNCSVSHQSSESLQIACSEGFSGGLPQNFLLEIFDAAAATNTAGSSSHETAATTRPTPPELKTNQTSMKPVFIVRGLSADTAYLAHVTAVNAKGRSEPLVVRIVTLRLPETRNNIGSGKSEGPYYTVASYFILFYFSSLGLLCARGRRARHRPIQNITGIREGVRGRERSRRANISHRFETLDG